MSSEVVTAISDVRARVAESRRRGEVIGFVPTMGALHAGHGALIERAKADACYTVVSIFVNPIQFDRTDDYERYARTMDEDVKLCSALGAELVFAPDAAEMYPAPLATTVDVAHVSEGLCGAYRAGHFRGVSTVVAKLFHIVQPDRAYFGEKDAQQLAVIRRMAADLNMPVEIVAVPTVREPDGLALSSRNRRLNHEERRAAPILYQALLAARDLMERGGTDVIEIKQSASKILGREPSVRVEYFEIVDPGDMQPVKDVSQPVRVAVAAWIGPTRLIDNVLCVPPGQALL